MGLRKVRISADVASSRIVAACNAIASSLSTLSEVESADVLAIVRKMTDLHSDLTGLSIVKWHSETADRDETERKETQRVTWDVQDKLRTFEDIRPNADRSEAGRYRCKLLADVKRRHSLEVYSAVEIETAKWLDRFPIAYTPADDIDLVAVAERLKAIQD